MLSEIITLGPCTYSYVTPTDTRRYQGPPWRAHTRATARDHYRKLQRCWSGGGVGCDGPHHRSAQGAVLEAALPLGAAGTTGSTLC